MSFENRNQSPGDITSVKVCPCRFCERATTNVLWDLKDFPLPCANLIPTHLVSRNISSFVKGMGFSDLPYSIWAYGDEILPTSDHERRDDVGILIAKRGSDDEVVMDIINFASFTFNSRSDLVVISKNLPKDLEFIRVLNALRSRCKVLLIHPHDETTSDQELFRDADSSISTHAKVDRGTTQCVFCDCEGGNHVYLNDSHGGDHDVMPMDYFSRTIFRDIEHLRTAVFWDVEDYPIPDGFDPFMIYRIIKQTLRSKGHSFIGDMSIFAYVDHDKMLSHDTLVEYHKARIYFIPRVPGTKYARARRMLHDIWFWLIDSPVDGIASPNLILFSNKVSGGGDMDINCWLNRLNCRGFNLFLVEVPPETHGSSKY